jgi:hypothetical protein
MFTRFILCALTLASLAGCGLSDYESRMNKRLVELQALSRFQDLYGPTAIETVADPAVKYPITIRLPKQFQGTDWFTPESDYRNTGAPAEPGVLYPPFLGEFPGLVRMGEQFERDDKQQRHSYYAYLGIVETRAMKTVDLLKMLRDKTRSTLPTTSQWEKVECPTEDLGTIAWQRLTAKGAQYFEIAQVENAPTKKEPGEFQVYVREDQGYIVLWAARVPDAIRDKVFLIEQSEVVAGTVKVTAPAPTEPLPKKPAAKTDKAANGKSPDTKAPTKQPAADDQQPANAADKPSNGDLPTDDAPKDGTPADETVGDTKDKADEAAKSVNEKPADKPVDEPTPKGDAPGDAKP